MLPTPPDESRSHGPASFRHGFQGGKHPGERPARRYLRVPKLLALIALSAVLLPLLPWLLSVSTPLPARSGVIYVFPGQVPDRAQCAARLFHAGVAPIVVFSGASIRPELTAIGHPLSDAELNSRIAGDQGVPADARVVLPEGTSTWEDAQVLASWIAPRGVSSVIAVTSPLHSRRALWSLQLALRSSGTDVYLASCGSELGPLWWQSERSLVGVAVEGLKLLYYGPAHFAPAALSSAMPDAADLPRKADDVR
jgi:uncharacterized SAM-binding protein YcdF (DUF218 family)